MLEYTKVERVPLIHCGSLMIAPQCYMVTINDKEINLYPKEFDVLYLLTQYPGWVLSAEQIYRSIWQEELFGCKYVIYNVVCQLRRKLADPNIVQTIKGRGYKLVIKEKRQVFHNRNGSDNLSQNQSESIKIYS